MPIVRTYACGECGHFMEVTLTMKQANRKPPHCPVCATRTYQEFKPIAIGGSVGTKARDYAERIASDDYHVADMKASTEAAGKLDVRYKDVTPAQVQIAADTVRAINRGQATPLTAPPSSWGTSPEVLEKAVALGRQVRQRYGSGLDVLQKNLKDGTQPDLIEISKKRSMRVVY